MAFSEQDTYRVGSRRCSLLHRLLGGDQELRRLDNWIRFSRSRRGAAPALFGLLRNSTHTLEGNTLPVAFIRYNPDAYHVDGKLTRILKKDRESRLIEILKSWTFDRPIYFMYYDTTDREPSVFQDSEFDDTLKNFFIGCI